MNDSLCKKPGNKDIKQMAQELEDEEAQKVLSDVNIKRILKKKGVTL
jgi:DNA-directed RNA polymerase specialized sigma54-like protein